MQPRRTMPRKFSMIFVARDQSSEPLQPGKQPFDTPTSLVSSQLTPVLGLTAALPVRRDQVDPVIALQSPVQRIRVVGPVADQSCREFVEKASGQGFLDEFCFVRRGTIGGDGRGRLVTAAMAMIFVPLPRLVGLTARSPFSRSRKCRPAGFPPAAAARDHGVPAPVPAVLYSVVRCVPIAENAGDRSDRVDTLGAVLATAPPCAESTIPHSAPPVGLAAAFPARRAVAESAAAVLTPPTLRY